MNATTAWRRLWIRIWNRLPFTTKYCPGCGAELGIQWQTPMEIMYWCYADGCHWSKW